MNLPKYLPVPNNNLFKTIKLFYHYQGDMKM